MRVREGVVGLGDYVVLDVGRIARVGRGGEGFRVVGLCRGIGDWFLRS